MDERRDPEEPTSTVYRFPDDDFAIVMGARVPQVGSSIRTRGELWTVTEVTPGVRTLVRLERPDVRPPSSD